MAILGFHTRSLAQRHFIYLPFFWFRRFSSAVRQGRRLRIPINQFRIRHDALTGLRKKPSHGLRNGRTEMKKSRYMEEQIIEILKPYEAGVKTADLCREDRISESRAST
jgi:hypothetical protein